MENKEYYTVIEAHTSDLFVDFRELWRYKDLIVLFVQRNFAMIYKQTILGPLWIILNPLITSIIFTYIFGGLAGLSTDGVPQFLFYMAGNTMWNLLSSSVTGTSNTFTTNAGVFGKVYFPRLTVPISQVVTSLVNFGIQFCILLIAMGLYAVLGYRLAISKLVIMVPFLLIQCILLALSVGIIISSLTTKYRDLAIAVGFGVQLWMYCTPIVYSLEATGGNLFSLLLLNPMTPIVHNFRHILFGVGELLVWPWVLSVAVTFVLLIVGVAMFNKIEKTFMDTV